MDYVAKRIAIPDTSVRSAKTCVSHFEDDRRRVARIIVFIQERRRNVSTEKAPRVLPSVFFYVECECFDMDTCQPSLRRRRVDPGYHLYWGMPQHCYLAVGAAKHLV